MRSLLVLWLALCSCQSASWDQGVTAEQHNVGDFAGSTTLSDSPQAGASDIDGSGFSIEDPLAMAPGEGVRGAGAVGETPEGSDRGPGRQRPSSPRKAPKRLLVYRASVLFGKFE